MTEKYLISIALIQKWSNTGEKVTGKCGKDYVDVEMKNK